MLNRELGVRVPLSLAMVVAFALALSTPARAAMITVTTLSDPTGTPGTCSLRDAITAANTMTETNGCTAGSGNDTVRFRVGGTISLANPLPQITTRRLTINGPASPGITINGAGVEVLQVGSGATLIIQGLTIAHGSGKPKGGGVFNEGTLTITNVMFSDNLAVGGVSLGGEGQGGAIYNDGKLAIGNSTFSGNGSCCYMSINYGAGGAIFNLRTLTITNSTFSGNNSGALAGAIFNGGTLTITNSTFSRNAGGHFGFGGAIASSGTLTVNNSTFSDNGGSVFAGGGIQSSGTLTVAKSTFSGNSAFFGSGGAIAAGGTLSVTNSTFFDNGANEEAGGIYSTGILIVTSSTFSANRAYRAPGAIFTSDSASIKNTILAGSGSIGNRSGTIADLGYNISDDHSCGFARTGSANNGDNVNPLLSSDGLANNGGPTQTIALSSKSPAREAIPVADCTDQAGKRLGTDQRGFPRPDFGEEVCDIGAYESQDTFAGTPGTPNCHGVSVAALVDQYGNVKEAALALRFPSVKALQDAIRAYCKDWPTTSSP
jgi:CSLREA domain-containing protein